MNINIKTKISAPFNVLLENFNQELFLYLKPPLMEVDLKQFDGCRKNDSIILELSHLFGKNTWESLVTEEAKTDKTWYFIDEGKILPPPLKDWRHTHIVHKINEEECYLIDDINYKSSNVFLDVILFPVIYFQFWFRKNKYQQYFKIKRST